MPTSECTAYGYVRTAGRAYDGPLVCQGPKPTLADWPRSRQFHRPASWQTPRSVAASPVSGQVVCADRRREGERIRMWADQAQASAANLTNGRPPHLSSAKESGIPTHIPASLSGAPA